MRKCATCGRTPHELQERLYWVRGAQHKKSKELYCYEHRLELGFYKNPNDAKTFRIRKHRAIEMTPTAEGELLCCPIAKIAKEPSEQNIILTQETGNKSW